MRLVKESDYMYLLGLVKSHIEGLGHHVIDHEPTEAERLEHSDIVTFTYDFSYSAYLYGEEPILIRTSGGSVPISPFVETLGVPAAKVPTVNIDNNQHSPNENIRLGNFLEGIAILMSVLSQTPD
jgi:acetylornithine deacetylase/succinyl-diaminopimelate desuccinylase-like protein